MMANIHALPHNGSYAIRRTKSKRVSLAYMTAAGAWSEARRRALKLGIIAYRHDSTGRIVERCDYREDSTHD